MKVITTAYNSGRLEKIPFLKMNSLSLLMAKTCANWETESTVNNGCAEYRPPGY
jgi:hypothetical protein